MSDEEKIEVVFADKDKEDTGAPESEVPEEEAAALEPEAEEASPDAAAPEEPPPEQEESPGFSVKDRRFWNRSEEELEEEDEDQPEVPSYVEELQRKLEGKDKQLREYIAAYKKEVGEGLDRTKGRLEREADQKLARTRDKMVLPMLDVLDALERSVQAADQSDNFDALLDGVRMVQKLMVQRLEEMGLSRVPGVGAPFDPNMHEALAVAPVEDPAQDKMVVMEFKPGFMLGDRVVRAAQVQVGKMA